MTKSLHPTGKNGLHSAPVAKEDLRRALQVLLLEDSAADASRLVEELRQGGVKTDAKRVATKAAFVQQLAKAPDVIIADYNLKAFNPAEAIALIRMRAPETPVIIVSHENGEERAMDVMKLGATDYLWKDRLERLPQAVVQAVEARQLRVKVGRSEKAVRDAERSLELAQSVAQIGSWEYSLSARGELEEETLTWSRETYRIFGQTKGRFRPTKKRFLELVHPDDLPIVSDGCRALIEDGVRYAIDHRIIRPDGSTRYVHAQAEIFSLAGPDGRAAIVGTIQDISARIEAETALRQSEANLIVAQRIAHVGSWEWNIVADTVHWSREVFDFFGLEPADFNGKASAFFACVHPEDRVAVEESLRRALAGIGHFRHEHRIVRPDGGIRYAQSEGEVSFAADGTPLRMSGTVQDVTQRQEAEALLRNSEERYRMLFDANPLPMWVYNPETLRFLDVNEAAIRHYGYSRAEFGRMSVMEIRPPEEVPLLLEYFARAEKEKTFPRLTWRHLKKDGTPILVEVTNQSIDYNHEPARLVLANDVTEQRMAGDALRRSEALLRAFSDTMPQLVWGADAQGAITYFNERAVEFLGLPPEEIRGEGWLLAVHAQDRAATWARWQHSLQTGQDFEMQYRLRRADGVYRWHLARAVRVEGETAETTQWCGTNTDLDDQLRAQTALAEAQRVARMGSWSMLLEGKQHTWSAEMYRLLGVNPETFVPSLEASPQFIHPDDRARYLSDVRRILEDHHPVADYYRIVRPDGVVRVVHQRVALEMDAEGKPRRIHGTAQDVTELRAAEEQVRKQASLLDLAQDAIMVHDLEHRVSFWNRGAERLYGWSAEEAVGQFVNEIIYEDTEPYFNATAELLEKGEWTGELQQVRRGGEVVIVNCRWSLVRDEQGQPQSVFVINSDITDKRKLESQFRRAQRLESIGTLASGVAHDLNNVLVPILMVAPLLRDNISVADREKFLGIVEASAQRGASIVKQVLTFARGADGTRALLQPIYLMQEIVRIVEETFPKRIRVQCHYPEDLRTIEADATQLHQVLLNLCVNARDAMPRGGQLTLQAENFDVDEHYASMSPTAKAGPHVLLQVSDSGSGIPPQVIEKIFDPFFTTKEIGVGTGLGLSTVLGIVKSHGGFVNVTSEPGHTCFKIFLPSLGEVLRDLPPPPTPDLPLGTGQTILIVDDEPAIREIAAALLGQQGYKVLVAEDGPAALALFARASSAIHLVLTDMAMPYLDGPTLIRTLRRMDPRIKIMVSTGRAEDCRSAELKSLRVEGCLAKPYTRQQLLALIHQILSGSSRSV